MLTGLTDEQLQAITHKDGPMLVIACPGAGKTRVVTTRIAYLIKREGIDPNSILALTFTKKAANEMKERLIPLVGDKLPQRVSTFHSYCSMILREDIHNLNIQGLNSNYIIADANDQQRLIVDILKDVSEFKDFTTSQLRRIASSVKSCISFNKISNNSILNGTNSYKLNNIGISLPSFNSIYSKYITRNIDDNKVDFDDLLLYVDKLFNENKQILNKYQNLNKYILVDEYQDTSKLQYNIISKLAAKHNNIHVTGDADQAIYGWRGADFRIILGFKEDFPNSKIIILNKNFRSYQDILDISSSVIKNNVERTNFTLVANKGKSKKSDIIGAFTGNTADEEALKVAKIIQYFIKNTNHKYSDIAVLYRNHFLSRPIEEAFGRLRIPYTIKNARSFYDRKEICIILDFLKFFLSPNDKIALRTMLEEIKGVGKITSDKIISQLPAKTSAISYFTDSTLRDMNAKQEIYDFFSKTRKIANMKDKNAFELMSAIYKIFKIEDIVNSIDENGESRVENAIEFLNRAKIFVTNSVHDKSLNAFLEDIALLSDSDVSDSDNKVTLSSGHAAKGLEWPIVFIIGVNEGTLPSHRINDADDLRVAIEEERRLFYVMCTRAKDRLYISYPLTKIVYSNGNYTGKKIYLEPSRFLEEAGFVE